MGCKRSCSFPDICHHYGFTSKRCGKSLNTSLSQAEFFQTDIHSTGVLPLLYAGQGPSLNTFLHLSVAFFTDSLLCLKLAAILSKKRSGVGDTASVLAAWIHHLQSVGDAGTLLVCFVHALESDNSGWRDLWGWEAHFLVPPTAGLS